MRLRLSIFVFFVAVFGGSPLCCAGDLTPSAAVFVSRTILNAPDAPFDVRPRPFTASNTAVVLVEDAHCNLPVQKQIAVIVQSLTGQMVAAGISRDPLVMQEGSTDGAIDTSVLRQDAQGSFDDYLAAHLKDGTLGGVEFLHARSGGFRYYGIEDPVLYERNYEHFMAITNAQPSIDAFIADLDAKMAAIRDLVCSSDLTEAMALCERFDAGGFAEKSLEQYMEMIYQYDVARDDLPVTRRLFEIVDAIRTVSGDGLAREMSLLPRSSGRVIDAEQVDALFAKGSISQEQCPLVYRWARLRSQLFSVDMAAFIGEYEQGIARIITTMADTDAEREYVSIWRSYVFMKKMFTFQLARDEYDGYISIYANLRSVCDRVIDYVVSFYEKYMPAIDVATFGEHAVGFYQTVNERDRALTNTIVQRMTACQERLAIAVVGGFHSDGIARLLAEKGIGCVVLTPTVATIDRSSMTKYSQVMTDFWRRRQ